MKLEIDVTIHGADSHATDVMLAHIHDKLHEILEVLHSVHLKEQQIMSAISDFAAKQNEFNDKIDTAVTGLTDDIKALADEIKKLQDSAGTITPEDQALLDGIQARTGAIADKLTALDGLNPPAPPAG